MAAAGSADEFKIASIPFVMDLLFKSLDKVTGNRNTSLILMGKAQFKPLEIPSFGSWVNPSKNFTLKEMRGLYGALLDPTKFGPFTDSSLRTRCLNGTLAKECGLSFNLYHLDIFYKTGDFFNLLRVAGFVKELLCPSPTFSCFVDNIFNPHLRDAGYYIIELSKHVLSYLESNNYGLVTSRKQSEITLGYQLPPVPGFPSGISVPGSVTSHSSETIAKEMGTNSTFYTCKSTEGDRFTFAGRLITYVHITKNASSAAEHFLCILDVRGDRVCSVWHPVE